MRLASVRCDGCGRLPGFWEWVRGEFTASGYPEWHHPGMAFREAGCPINRSNRARAARAFEALFGRPLPEEPGFLCPQCQQRVRAELPGLLQQLPEPSRSAPPRYHLGD